ncbi:Uncharacterised protein [Enterobacter cloacae]|uniref:DUF551 domain-containing protein n=3 Tax=Enterobacter cloacae TaxID=550 RepID=A0A0H3CI84_ENTCC|nr:hypothetical protein ECL_01311 [Enterobacter cloacae subsp. cloacae ATCC 13047]KGB03605.1 hypothetical protein DR74_452 [Enterobacter cloacae]CUI53722.1 Uncharacterised protein [Enterobacter cloacae]STQ13587.1 Uncharacterised protein [Enterobacter cloacae]
MITFTKEQLIASAHARIEFAEMMLAGELEPLKERTWSIELELARIALASLEAEPVGEVSEQRDGLVMDGTVDLGGASTHRIIKGASKMKRLPLGTKFYTAPPAPVSVPDAMEMDDDFDSAFEHGKAVGWNACRAAILQGADGNSPAHSGCRPAQNCISPAQCGNSPAIPDGWVMVPEEPTHEMLEAGDEQFGTYDVYRRMIAASPQQK